MSKDQSVTVEEQVREDEKIEEIDITILEEVLGGRGARKQTKTGVVRSRTSEVTWGW